MHFINLIKYILCLSLFVSYELNACITAIISGKFTPDGHPLLWKHRDTDEINNKFMYFSDGKYAYIGLVDSKDIER